ncbi:MAG: rRNA pseudouridine synthase [Hyphomicrobiaceae bacterium]|nr:rRNA pseudouridine synthase [Hyphomicrobiaceae bacterium]
MRKPRARQPQHRPDAERGKRLARAPSSPMRPPRRQESPVQRQAHAGGEAATGLPHKMRIAKAIARAGLCSRRDAERWIADGRVGVNGKLLESPARDVGPDDVVTVDGKPLPGIEPVRLWRYYKPRGLVTTHRDPEGRPTVFEKLPEEMPRVISVGRLDFNTEGLLLLTTDGTLARHLELPSTGWLRRYRVRAHGTVTQADLDRLKDGIVVEGVRYGPIEATLDRVQGSNVWLTIGLREGKNREVRKVLGTLALDVNRLIRISFGPFQLLDLEPGQTDPVRRRVLVDQLGVRMARELGLTDVSDDEIERRHSRKSERKGSEPATKEKGVSQREGRRR